MTGDYRRPVFIVGAARSGTSILYRTLLKHPVFSVVGDEALQLAESGILNQLDRAHRWGHRKPPRLWSYFLQDDASYDRFVAEVKSQLHDKPSAPDPDIRPPWAEGVLNVFVAEATRTRSCRRLIEKTPTHIDRAQWLLECLPTARLLYIHRQPVDTYSSFVRRARTDRVAGSSWADLTVEEFAEMYNRQSVHAHELGRSHSGRFKNVAYEAFVSEPAALTTEVCAFLEETFHPEMIEETAPDLTRARHDPHLYSDIAEKTKDWVDFIDVAAARKLEDLTAGASALWGYERHT